MATNFYDKGKKIVSQYDKCLKDYRKYIQKVADNLFFFEIMTL